MNSTLFDVFRTAALLVLTPKCFDNYFLEFNYLDGPCFFATLSKGLGFGIILGSLTVKVPQILKILNNKSGEGINILSVTLDLSAITIYMAYSFVKGFPFSAWGDASFLAIQTVLIGYLVLYYQGAITKAITYLLVYVTVCYVMMFGMTPLEFLWSLQTFNIFLVVVGKLMQAYTNLQNGHTGQLSAATLIMLLAGSLARIFTSMQETGDSVVILTYIASSLSNAVLVVQLLYYWNVDPKKKVE
ncbi:mannose-P-dolichol utilization defect 1 protein homolog isoform X1 [Diabrotica virgifera virgifera]|uniref:Mannose-P-dolichol utilization defect 1 protein homolog n=1 Tax=Diabrotica virgifera virgifera TaxID=50390 RepID=A0ABM5IAF7_DIAVI|nr:mannose-P-dolichol utilization defect 1 protein homolog isoform X1 [Diabrotica virgifera virgifera]